MTASARLRKALARSATKKTEVNAADEFELPSYMLSDFTVKPIGPSAALVTYSPGMKVKPEGKYPKEKASVERSGFVPATDGKISTCKKPM
jgi:hypothetical protein